ncbi:MAG TPA: glycosyl transferase family 90 [Bacteroidaceae bacterium]|nr:glycosyl transferase family 90 [Bacteroidaceae bacterium]
MAKEVKRTIIQSIKEGQYKHNKFLYFVQNLVIYFCAKFLQTNSPLTRWNKLSNEEKHMVLKRVKYYNKLDKITIIPEQERIFLKDFKRPKKKKRSKSKRKGGSVTTYFFDTFRVTKYFSKNLYIALRFGDVTEVPHVPALVKSRPIHGSNHNAIVLKLNKIRHFLFIKDPVPFEQKENILIGRSVVALEKRKRFFEMYFDHPLCNIGNTGINTGAPAQWGKDRLTILEHLKYKFILCIEGVDVATNLKWVMSSNSLAVMPNPEFETWFMEGTLIPNYHYIQIKRDYSDLEERLQYYINHPEEAKAIIKHAHEYIEQFKNKKLEKLIGVMVMERYFEKTGQLDYCTEYE